MLTCRDIAELVTDYLDGSMPLTDRLLFQVHLATCVNCRAYLRQLELTRDTLGKVPKVEVPPHLEAELRKHLAAWKK